MPIETLQETIRRHSEHGGHVPVGNGRFLFGDGALMQNMPGHNPSIQEPPHDEVERLHTVREYWRRRTALVVETFDQFKNALLGKSFNVPQWRQELWGKEPDVSGENALLFLRDLVHRERERLAEAEAAYEAHPVIVAQRKAHAERERIDRERAQEQHARQARILAITLD